MIISYLDINTLEACSFINKRIRPIAISFLNQYTIINHINIAEVGTPSLELQFQRPTAVTDSPRASTEAFLVANPHFLRRIHYKFTSTTPTNFPHPPPTENAPFTSDQTFPKPYLRSFPRLEKVTLDFRHATPQANWYAPIFSGGHTKSALAESIIKPIMTHLKRDVFVKIITPCFDGQDSLLIESRQKATGINGVLRLGLPLPVNWARRDRNRRDKTECLTIRYHPSTMPFTPPPGPKPEPVDPELVALVKGFEERGKRVGWFRRLFRCFRGSKQAPQQSSSPATITTQPFPHLPMSLHSVLIFHDKAWFRLSKLHLEGVRLVDNAIITGHERPGRLRQRPLASVIISQRGNLCSLVIKNCNLHTSAVQKAKTRTGDDGGDLYTAYMPRYVPWDSRLEEFMEQWERYAWEDVLQGLMQEVWPLLRECSLEGLMDSWSGEEVPGKEWTKRGKRMVSDQVLREFEKGIVGRK
ncbi:hypothetical protein BJ508DRAFT_413732 [Ascobolus immersus RN42]|uniref:Uncharacterized protein n=1 Tax=Ascobolus immersus RN42 TaxID=1160509 RepID=A0A3N4IC98_ASCIM|nr:hypothetical protein BJ508DRAFT_413732 [Ascobolus immersus RN42]